MKAITNLIGKKKFLSYKKDSDISSSETESEDTSTASSEESSEEVEKNDVKIEDLEGTKIQDAKEDMKIEAEVSKSPNRAEVSTKEEDKVSNKDNEVSNNLTKENVDAEKRKVSWYNKRNFIKFQLNEFFTIYIYKVEFTAAAA